MRSISASVLIVLKELLALDRLVGDDEDPAFVRPTKALYLLAFGERGRAGADTWQPLWLRARGT